MKTKSPDGDAPRTDETLTDKIFNVKLFALLGRIEIHILYAPDRARKRRTAWKT